MITIGGSRATVIAPPTLIAPGTYQINLVVLNDVPHDDQVISATLAGATTQTGLLIRHAENFKGAVWLRSQR